MIQQREMVNHPEHNNHPIECVEAMEIAYGTHAAYYFCLCSAFNYRWNYGRKEGECNDAAIDTTKAQWYDDKARQLAIKIVDGNIIKPSIL